MPKILSFLLGLLILLLMGCFRVGPDFKSPGTTTQESWTEQLPRITMSQDVEIGPWWKIPSHHHLLNSTLDYIFLLFGKFFRQEIKGGRLKM